MLLRHQTKRHLVEPVRKIRFRRWHTRLLLLVVAIIVSVIMVTLTVLGTRSRTLVVRLHNSEQRFVEEALQGIILLPKKLAPTQSPAKTLKEKCDKLYKRKCRPCDGAVEVGEDQQLVEVLPAKDTGHADLSPREIWPARRRERLEDEGLQRLRQELMAGEEYRQNIDLMRVKLPPFLPTFKNPCFMTPPRTMTPCSAGAFQAWRRFAYTYHQGAVTEDGSKRRLSCLPYFLLTGAPKSGAGELLFALSHHRDVTYPLPFQSTWLETVRFDSNCTSVNTYLDFFDWSAQVMNQSADEKGHHAMVTGEVAEHLFWDNGLWPALPGNEGQLEPRFTNADYLYHLDPSVKVVVVLRNPTERLYAEYQERAAGQDGEVSAEDFHSRVQYQLDVLRMCLARNPLRSCVYDALHDAIDAAVPIRSGLYAVMLQDWLRVFPRSQVHVINQEMLQRRLKIELIKLVKFLDLKGVTLAQIDVMMQRAMGKNKVKKEEGDEIDEEEEEEGEDQEEEGGEEEEEKMLEGTREMLNSFYQPFNRLLATLVEEDSFMWEW